MDIAEQKKKVEVLMERWKPMPKAGDRIPKLSKEMQERLVILLDNAHQHIESDRMKHIFIPLTVELFLQIVEKRGADGIGAMLGPVAEIDGVEIKAGTRKITPYEMGGFCRAY